MSSEEITIKKKVVNSYLAGILGSAVADSHYHVSIGMQYQCLVLQAWFSLGKLPEYEDVVTFMLKNSSKMGLSHETCVYIIQRMSNESIFPFDKPWDTPFGWAFAFWPEEIRISGRLVAAAVAEALQPQASIQDVIRASLDACTKYGIEGTILHERLDAAIQLAYSCSSIQEFKQTFYEKFQIPVANTLTEVIPLALACIVLGEGKPFASIKAVLELERNTDQTACLAGQIAGALNEVDDLPSEILDHIITENPELIIRKTSSLLADHVIGQYQKAMSARKSIIELSKVEPPHPIIGIENSDLLLDKILGCLIGGACGDAMGCPVEWMHFEDISLQWGWVDRFINFDHQKHHPHKFYEGPTLYEPNAGYDTTIINPLGVWDLSKGNYSDDMRFRLLLCSAMLEKEGAVSGSEFADYLIRYRLQDASGEQLGVPSWQGPQRVWTEQLTSKVMLEALYGRRQPVGFCLTWDGPVGLMYPGNEELASRHGYLMATCIAHAFRQDATVDSIVECACTNSSLYGSLAQDLLNRIQEAVALARKSISVNRFYREFYNNFLVPQPSWQIYILEQIPATLALLTFGANDPKRAILSAVNFGRDADTIACMVGELIGTLFGASELPMDWIDTILAANPKPDIPAIATRFKDLAMKRVNKEYSSLDID